MTGGGNFLLRWIFGLAGVFVGVFCADAAEKAGGRPNIIVVIADDLSRELSTFLPEGKGKALMPRLESLAKEGVVLRNLHSPSPVCTPSRYAVLSGQFPSRCSDPTFVADTERDGQTVVEFNTHFHPEDTTLPKLLREGGYVTGAVGKNHMIAVEAYERLPYDVELEAPGVQDTLDRNARVLREAFQACGFDHAERLYFGNPDADGIRVTAMHNQEWITEGVLEFIDEFKEEPFFLYVATTIPHGPFEAERSWRGDPRVTPEGLLDPEEVPEVQAPRETIDGRLAEAGIDGWNTAPVLWLDDAMDAICQRLEEAGIADNTIIIFASDHGTEAKGAAYLRGTLTGGFVWKKGGFPAGHEVDADVQLTDLAPTILDWAGVAYDPKQFDGRTLEPLLEGETDRVHESLYFELGYSRAVIKDGFKYLALRYPEHVENMPLEERRRILEESNAILAERGRPIPTTDAETPFSHLFLIPGGHDVDQVAIGAHPAYFDRDQLYSLEDDPHEQVNLMGQAEYEETVKELKRELNRRVRKLPGNFGEFGGKQ